MPILRPGFTLGGLLANILKQEPGPTQDQATTLPDKPEDFMTCAFTQAMKGIGLPAPNPNVGCIIVKDHQTIAVGATEPFGGLHGEAAALLNFYKNYPPSQHELIKQSTAYIMLEPCAHTGKQPPCSKALINAGIRNVVVATLDPNSLVNGRGIAELTAAGIKVKTGVLQLEAKAFNLPFFFECHYQRPLIVGKWAQTLNGQLADDTGGSQWISGPLSRQYTHYLRQKYDAILVGAGTTIADFPALSVRDSVTVNRQPLKIIFDPSNRLGHDLPLNVQAKLRERTFAVDSKVLLVSENIKPTWLMNHAHINYLKVSSQKTAWQELISYIQTPQFIGWHGQRLQSILVEGGPLLLNYLLQQDALDVCHVFVAPALISATAHRIGYAPNGMGPGFATISDMKRFVVLQTQALGDDILMELIPQDRWQKIFLNL